MDDESTQNEIVGANGDGSQPPIAAVGDEIQPSNATEDILAVDASSLPPMQTRKRKPNASVHSNFCPKMTVTKFIILDKQPFKLAEGEGFKQHIITLQPQYTIPSRHTMSRDCFKLYLEEKERLMAEFRSNC
ncbi:uncharacterized protein LOC123910306 [Trifolium pratense]|uniref:uncharacterized protein LOC123910306 n=1 Tax=Trifolium pratense TaxID=57577 RepID=UPI001E691C5B|nr:uncharacterized protein LOC123910306 [Trifolium pratense]